MNHVISWSGGKDSTATVLLMYLHEDELIEKGDTVTVLFAEVMFDKEHGISGHNPEIMKWVSYAKDIFEGCFGYRVEMLHSDRDYLDIFYHKLKRSPDPARVGKTHGFVPSGICAVKRDCKLKPIREWYRQHPGDITQYIGIAADEPARLEALHRQPGTVSLLERYGLTEQDAMDLCRKYEILSPPVLDEGAEARRLLVLPERQALRAQGDNGADAGRMGKIRLDGRRA